MTTYLAPTRDMRFVIEELAGLDDLAALPGYEDVTPDLVEAVLEEAAKLAGEVLAPLNKAGDEQGARLKQDEVIAADGFADAYRQFVEGGWNGISGDPAYGGQGLPGGAGSDDGNVELGQYVVRLMPLAHRRGDLGSQSARFG